MKKLFVLFATLLVCSCMCFAEEATVDPAEGYWLSFDEKTKEVTAGWKIWVEDGKLFGTIMSTKGFPLDGKADGTKGKGPYSDFPQKGEMCEMTTVGTTWIYNLEKASDGNWSKGKIVDPSDGNRYKCKITFHVADGKKYAVDTLEMRGEIGMGIGRSQFWTKATAEEASALR
ncbi:MAG: DUF2147 domain-containing protein [Treponema sp.]|jgi:uncharacterized protein (DUF2147 family)|nr:DUF2147 domain-containing protein [Treponema sp.]